MEVINSNFENWGTYILKQFQYMYEKEEKCDLEISCNKQIFLVHRLIMSACSDYVRGLTDKQHIILPDEVSCRTLKTVIDFIYSGRISFKKDEKEELLLAASLLNMKLLVELIKPEESGGYTVQIYDDDVEESSAENEATQKNIDKTTDGESEASLEPPQANVHNQGNKRKSEIKHNRPKSSKNSTILPPLHKFPYLQQKFSASRTYGLVTNLTSPVPSRFHMTDAELKNSSFRPSFENISYDTERLFSEPDKLVALDAEHHQFLKKLRESPGHKRGYSNGLYSPFDKFQPVYNLRTTELNTSRRSSAVISYPSKAENTRNKTQTLRSATPNSTTASRSAAQAQKAKSLTAQSSKPSVTSSVQSASADSISTPSKSYKRVAAATAGSEETTKLAVPSTSSEPTPRKQVRFSDSIAVREIDTEDFTAQAMKELESLPEPIKPSQIVQGPCAIDNDETTELINLDNVILPTSYKEVQPVASEDGDANARQTLTELTNMPSSYQEIMEVEQSTPTDAPPPPEESVTTKSTEAVDETNTPKTNGNEETSCSSVDSFFSEPNLSEVKNLDSNAKKFILKVHDAETTTDQLSKLVGICKQNSLFKDKNVHFKLVPVKGLKDQTLLGSGINKAIIVKRTIPAAAVANSSTSTSPLPTSGSSNKSPAHAATVKCSSVNSNEKLAAATAVNNNAEKVTTIQNVMGPWICWKCDGETGEKFDSYFDYRTHLHSVHKEPNNPIYCIHCGHKSLKRNMQLYHLFVKHNVPPPSSVTFPKCDKCDYCALNKYSLQKHLTFHYTEDKNYVCSCKLTFKLSELLQKHLASGDCKNSKSFTCGYCRCIFDRFVNLKAHMRVCMKERSKPMLENNTERVTKTA